MKLYLENVLITSSNEFFQLKKEVFPCNDFPLHYHSEFELIYIIKGNGKRFIGNDVSEFKSGDIYFLGPNLPHTFYNKDFPDETEVKQIVLQFKEEFLGRTFFYKEAFIKIRRLFEKSLSGICIRGEYARDLGKTLVNMLEMDASESVITLLGIIDRMSKASGLQTISPGTISADMKEKELDRLGPVHKYLIENFKNNIDLEDAAAIACLSPTAFCRYFKKHTRKTFSEFILDLRVNYACQLLQQGKLNIAQICLESGFNNPSYFNRKFKELIKMTPLEYHRQYSPLLNNNKGKVMPLI